MPQKTHAAASEAAAGEVKASEAEAERSGIQGTLGDSLG